MNREQASELIKKYKEFPSSNLFSIRPYNYPLFYLMECFAKGWPIEHYHEGQSYGEPRENMDFEWLAHKLKSSHGHFIWEYVARNPNLTNTALGYVQEDLFSRYVGKCNPLKGPNTTWFYIPKKETHNYDEFHGMIGKYTKLYLLEIDLDTTDVIGKFDPKLPWHYLQQTINWKPWRGNLDWQGYNNENPISGVV